MLKKKFRISGFILNLGLFYFKYIFVGFGLYYWILENKIE
jgi:hypothetical protein